MSTGKKILVVDDDRVILTFASKLLTRSGHEVITAGDGFEALNVLSAFKPDIIFFDLIMPKIDGDKLIQIVRSMPHLKSCFLVIVSAAVAEIDFNFQETGADYYVAKGPFSAMAENFLAAIRAAEAPHPPAVPKPVVGLEHVYARQLTKELLSRNRHLETILESMAEGILEVYSGRIVYANSAAVAMLGIPPQKMLTAYPPDLFSGKVRERVAVLFAPEADGRSDVGGNQPLELNDRLVILRKLPVKGDESTVILMITDITERTRLENQLQHAQKMEAIGTIAAGVAHNFRNTLTEILVNSQLVQLNFKDQPTLQEVTGRINSSVKKGSRLVDGLLHFSRKQIGKEFKSIDLAAIIQETCQIVKTSFDARIQIEVDVPGVLPIMGDAAGISQVIMNLCTNARDAMPEGGRLRVEARSVSPARPRAGDRHGRRDGPRNGGEVLRPLLHHQAHRQGDRARPVHRVRHHQEPRRDDQRELQAGRGDRLPPADAFGGNQPRCSRVGRIPHLRQWPVCAARGRRGGHPARDAGAAPDAQLPPAFCRKRGTGAAALHFLATGRGSDGRQHAGDGWSGVRPPDSGIRSRRTHRDLFGVRTVSTQAARPSGKEAFEGVSHQAGRHCRAQPFSRQGARQPIDAPARRGFRPGALR